MLLRMVEPEIVLPSCDFSRETVFVFASKLTGGQVDVALCSPLCTGRAYAGKRAQMMAMLKVAV